MNSGHLTIVLDFGDNGEMPIGQETASLKAASPRRIGLVGCVKAKSHHPRPAKDLYISTLFRGRRSFVEYSCDEWWILSAEHGLVHPDQVLAPYDTALKGAGRAKCRTWSSLVLSSIDSEIRPGPSEVFEMHTGAEYRDFGVVDGLLSRGCFVENPTSEMRFGPQLKFYKEFVERVR